VSAVAEPAGRLLPRSAPRVFHLLAKPTGAVCNLDCTYCFFLSKEMLYPGSRFRMADDLLDSYLRQLIEAHAGALEVVVAWQGGEPTMMGLPFFRRSVELAEQYRRPGQRLSYTIQTNGTLLDDDWAAFFSEHGFLVGLSIDGPAGIHDAYRVDKGGKGSFDRVMKGLRTLQRHGVEWNALTTVHAANQHRGREVYAFLGDECGARFMIRGAMDAMCELLRAGRPPSELTRRYAAADSRRGRNDPCPCESGRKWKHCHQRTPA
jgi:uncharacterized protein